MTKEITSLSSKELKQFKTMTTILNKVYGLSSEDLDRLGSLAKENEELKKKVDDLSKRVQDLSSRLSDTVKSANSSAIQMTRYMNKKVEGFNLNGE